MNWSESEYLAYQIRAGRAGGTPAVASASRFSGRDGRSPANEATLHEQIMAECGRRRWIVFHGAMNKPTHRTGGEPDFVILADDTVHLIECKSAKGKLSPDQDAMRAWADLLGHTIHTVRSFEQFLEIVR